MYNALLDTISTFVELDAHEQVLIRQVFRPRQLAAGEHFLLEGEVCTDVGFVHTGLLHYAFNRGGELLTYAFASEGDFVCDYPSFLTTQPAQASIEAIEPTAMLTIARSDLQRVYREVAQGERFGRLVAEQLFVDVLAQLSSHYRDSPEERYLRFLQQFPHLSERLPQYYIAAFVGVQPQSLSRIRRRIAAGNPGA